jgi:release factor glutamine methyltransferase
MVGTSIDKAIADASARIPRREAELLAAHVLRVDRTWLATHARHVPDAAQAATYDMTVEARALGTPVAYLLGEREFYSRPFRVDNRVLIPRPETETLVEAALERVPAAAASVLDLGTGSGAIALTLALERPQWAVTAVDASEGALDCAQENAEALGCGSVVFLLSDWYAALEGWRFDAIVANPPYVAAHDRHLDEGDLRFEPRQALTDDSEDGLGSIRAIVAGAGAHLNPGGWLLLEHGYDQAEACRALFAAHGYTDFAAIADLAGIARVAAGRFPS